MDSFARETLPVPLEEEMRRSYLDYAMSVIVGRALPDVRDGLKPVHRRVLYAMHELGNDWNKPYKKSARIVGDVIGKYHPHGDTAVYDTIVRMAQDFSLRYPLIDGQGNFGSVDGDSPAAMRYTEIRMSRIGHEMLVDIDKETVDFGPNYDGSEREPLVLPTRRLLTILRAIREYLPAVRRISTYCLPRNLRKKSLEELRELGDLDLASLNSSEPLVLKELLRNLFLFCFARALRPNADNEAPRF